MANPNSVGELRLDSFGNVKVAFATAVSLASTGNAIANLSFATGGLTNGGAVSNSGQIIVRKITITSPVGSVASGNVGIYTSSDGNDANLITANTVLTVLSAAGRYLDVPITGAYGANTAISGSTTSALFVKVNTASGNANTVNISVYGDVVSF
jgi:hypothetical protein